MQIAAYAMAHDCVHGSKIQQGVIMICTPDLYYQEFKIEGLQLRKWKHEFLKRLDQYFELKNNSKEQANVNTSELLKEFEKDGNEA
jgi:genome maintenance exonuclease 1